MVKVNLDKSTHKTPFTVALLDATDAYYYADIMENMEPFDKFEDIKKAIVVADALFVLKNYKWESLKEMNHLDAGYDVRIYDSNWSCVYAAHEKYKDKWIGE